MERNKEKYNELYKKRKEEIRKIYKKLKNPMIKKNQEFYLNIQDYIDKRKL